MHTTLSPVCAKTAQTGPFSVWKRYLVHDEGKSAQKAQDVAICIIISLMRERFCTSSVPKIHFLLEIYASRRYNERILNLLKRKISKRREYNYEVQQNRGSGSGSRHGVCAVRLRRRLTPTKKTIPDPRPRSTPAPSPSAQSSSRVTMFRPTRSMRSCPPSSITSTPSPLSTARAQS